MTRTLLDPKEPAITNSPPSNSDPDAAYGRLHPEIQRWVRDQGWSRLRDLQTDSVSAILGSSRDVLIAAPTASGKTEAAFLPVLTQVADRNSAGLSVLYVSPLKALINDQYRRLETLCARMELPVVRWHADAPQAAKKAAVARPRGIALITPESIEALFVRRPGVAHALFGRLSFIIVDEQHSFMSGPRGVHLASLLKRINALSKDHPRRIGLSATIGNLMDAARWLRPDDPAAVSILDAKSGSNELQLQIRGYRESNRDRNVDEAETVTAEGETPALRPALSLMNDHLFATLRGSNNLIFAASRRTVEAVADGLRQRSEQKGVPNEFFPHHGSLAKELREPLEERLKAGSLPTTAVCTSTLELGVDIGSVKSVAQVGAPRSLASLKQRLGRSGRKAGVPSILRVYVREFARGPDTSPLDLLRPSLVRAVAAIRLLLRGFVEPAGASAAVPSALLHQTLSIIAERGGARADLIYRILGGAGPFAGVTPAVFAELLRAMAGDPHHLIEQAPDGTLMLGGRGEKLVQSRDFFALFSSDVEWRIVVGGKTLGTIPISNAIAEGGLIVFAGRRWKIEAVDDAAKVLEVVPHQGGRIPKFDRLAAEDAHDELIAEMRRLYEDDKIPPYLDPIGKDLLREARETYVSHNLRNATSIMEDDDLHVFLWRGSSACSVFGVALAKLGFSAENHDFGVTVARIDRWHAAEAIKKLAELSANDLAAMPAAVRNLELEKYDAYIPRAFLERQWAQRHEVELNELRHIARTALAGMGTLPVNPPGAQWT